MAVFRYTWRSFGRELLLIFLAAVWWIPFYFLLIDSVKPSPELFTNANGFPHHLEFGNYVTAWQGTGGESVGSALVSSAIITVGSIFCLIVIGAVCAYAIGRRSGRSATLLYLLFSVAIIIPFQLGVIPTYVVLRSLHLAGSYLGMIVLYTGLLMPFSVFLYTGFVRQLPRDYEEAAYVDGASRLRTFVRVVFPQLRPATATVGILAGVIIWNDFFMQVIFLYGSNKETLPVLIYSFVGQYASQWNLIFATVAVMVAPVLICYIVAQRHMVRGLSGGIKA